MLNPGTLRRELAVSRARPCCSIDSDAGRDRSSDETRKGNGPCVGLRCGEKGPGKRRWPQALTPPPPPQRPRVSIPRLTIPPPSLAPDTQIVGGSAGQLRDETHHCGPFITPQPNHGAACDAARDAMLALGLMCTIQTIQNGTPARRLTQGIGGSFGFTMCAACIVRCELTRHLPTKYIPSRTSLRGSRSSSRVLPLLGPSLPSSPWRPGLGRHQHSGTSTPTVHIHPAD